jgi:hypothetical protein
LLQTFAALLTTVAMARSTGKGQELTNGYNIEVTWNETTSMVTFTAVIPDKTWLGLVLGSFSHVNSDMILFSANGASSKFYDLYSDGYFMPLDDDVNNLSGSFVVSNGEVKFTVQRKMDTGDRL